MGEQGEGPAELEQACASLVGRQWLLLQGDHRLRVQGLSARGRVHPLAIAPSLSLPLSLSLSPPYVVARPPLAQSCRVQIRYDDNEVKWHKMWEEDFSFIDHPDLEPRSSAVSAPVPSSAAAAAAGVSGSSDDDSDDDVPLSTRAAALLPAAGGASAALCASLAAAPMPARSSAVADAPLKAAHSATPTDLSLAAVAAALRSFEESVPAEAVTKEFRSSLKKWRSEVCGRQLRSKAAALHRAFFALHARAPGAVPTQWTRPRLTCATTTTPHRCR